MGLTLISFRQYLFLWRKLGNFRCGYFCLRFLWNPWGYFQVGTSFVLPSKISECNLINRKGPSYVKVSQWWFDVILWWIKTVNRFGETSLSFQPQFKNFSWISMWILVSFTTQISAWIPSTINHNPRRYSTESTRFCPLGCLRIIKCWAEDAESQFHFGQGPAVSYSLRNAN